MGNYIYKYNSNKEYYTDTTRQFPNVSLVEGKIKFESEAQSPISKPIVVPSLEGYDGNLYTDLYGIVDKKWFKLNDNYEYEEYGIVEEAEELSAVTTYEGKLCTIGTTEYQYSGDSWVEVGEVVDSSTTYPFDMETIESGTYDGMEFSTTFKISKSDIESVGGYFGIMIRCQDGELMINPFEYSFNWEEMGEITEDDDWMYYSLPETQTVTIEHIMFMAEGTLNIVVGSKGYTVEYAEKAKPTMLLSFESVDEMNQNVTPTVGVNQYCYTNGQAYRLNVNDEWVAASDTEFTFKAIMDDGTAMLIPNGVTDKIDESTSIPKNVESLFFGKELKEIGYEAFYECNNLKSVIIPNTVKSIKNVAFGDCNNISAVSISNSTSVDESVFMRCPSLPIYGNAHYADTVLAKAASLDITSAKVKEGTRVIQGYSFQDCTSLESVEIPNGIETIGNSAFNGCTSLTSVVLPKTISFISFYAFDECSSLSSITILATTPPQIGFNHVFGGSGPIYVPQESVDAYKTATNWDAYASRIQSIPSE